MVMSAEYSGFEFHEHLGESNDIHQRFVTNHDAEIGEEEESRMG